MKKIILSFALLFAILFLNSCKEDDTVTPPIMENTYKITKFTENFDDKYGKETYEYDIKYNGDLIDSVYLKLNNILVLLNHKYKDDKLNMINFIAEKDGQKIENILELSYENNNLKEIIRKGGTENSIYTKYNYSGSNLTEVLYVVRSVVLDDNQTYEGWDTTIYSEFIDGFPTKKTVNYFSTKIKSGRTFINDYKLTYKNGNLDEIYLFNEFENKYILETRYEYNLNKPNLYKNFELIRSFTNNKAFIPSAINKNLMTKEISFTLECDSTDFDEPKESRVTTINYTYDTNGNVLSGKSSDIFYCKEAEEYAKHYEVLIEWKK